MRAKIATCTAAMACLLLQFTPAHAARVIKYNLQAPGPFVITGYSDQTTIVSLPGEVELAFHKGQASPVTPMFEHHSREVRLVPIKGSTTSPGDITVVTEQHTIRFLVYLVDRSKAEAYDRAEFYDGHTLAAKTQTLCQGQFRKDLAQIVFKGVRVTRLGQEVIHGRSIAIERPKLVTLGERQQFVFHLKNSGFPVLKLHTIRALADDGRREHTRYIEVDTPQPAKQSEHLLELPKGHTVKIIIEVDSVELLGAFAIFDFVAPGGMSLATRKITFFDPEDPPNKRRFSIQGQAVRGAVNLINASNTDDTDFTSLTGIGARAVYGFSKNLSLEGSVLVSSTGNAEFADSSTGMAKTVRALFGGVLQAGDTYTPYLRVGIGLRGVSYNSTPTEGAPTSDFGVSALLRIGAGIDVWLGDNVVIGVSAGYVAPFTGSADESYSLEAGLHAGFAWKLGDN